MSPTIYSRKCNFNPSKAIFEKFSYFGGFKKMADFEGRK